MAAPPPRPPRQTDYPAYYGRTQRRRPPPPGRLDFLRGAFRPLKTLRIRFKRRVKQTGGPTFYRLLTLFASIAIAIALLAGTIYLAARKNANDVYVGDARVGSIKMNKKVTADSLKNIAVNKIENEIGMRILINEEVTFNPARTSSKNTMTEESVIAAIADALTYKVEAAVISVEGGRFAALKSITEAESIRENLLNAYVQEGSIIVELDFVEDFKIIPQFIEIYELIDSERAYRELTATAGVEETYTVRGGDTLWQISVNSGMSLDELYELNPGLTSNIYVGQQIKMTMQKPVLSVRTVEEVKYTEVVPKSTEYISNNTQPKTYSRVIQQGRDGQQDVTSHIERINGFTVGSKVVDYIITNPAVDDIIEIGTK